MKRLAAIIAAVLIVCMGWWLFAPSSQPIPAKSGASGQTTKVVPEVVLSPPNPGASSSAGASPSPGERLSFAERMVNAFSTPITFYGRVLDQHGAPVVGAVVRGSAAVSMGGNSTKVTTTTDAAGHFTLRSKGMSFFVTVDKPGYYHIYPGKMPGLVSEKGFDYAEDLGRGIHKPDASKPVILHLFKPGTIEPLTRIKSTSHRLSRTGKAVEIELDKGAHRISLACTTEDEVTPDGRFSWSFEVKVIQGGLQPAGETFQFEAPETGYKETDVIDMNDSLPRPQWADSVRRSYFVRFNDNTFARIKVEMIAFGDFFTVIEGYYNPKSGSRNLAADPSQR
ncbi:Carboxypeptidase regulatory-like domain-containing protein [Prosthecobacter debontii]|uniref:Carboxypeptidase regulatory-like domain-containing protein n=2 Tax=Prosthecobacter debontii TaxID=48467 RepID=A0A1T4XXQ2_9BACT|nr:Carboxypeptidase regulatory-like domain-containing protein [Prosthecobacter debontii]